MAPEYVGMCGPILVINLLHVRTVCHPVKRLVDRNEDKPAKSAPKIRGWVDLCQVFNGRSLIVLLPQVSADYCLVVKQLSDSRADRG